MCVNVCMVVCICVHVDYLCVYCMYIVTIVNAVVYVYVLSMPRYMPLVSVAPTQSITMFCFVCISHSIAFPVF